MIFIKMIDDNLYTQGVLDAGSLQCCIRHCVRAGVPAAAAAAAKMYHQNSNRGCL